MKVVLLPDMYIMKRFMGTCLMGPSAMSQLRLFLSLLWSPLSLWASAWSAPDMAVLYPGGGGPLEKRKGCGHGLNIGIIRDNDFLSEAI